MKKKTKTQQALEYIEGRGSSVSRKDTGYDVDGKLHSAHSLRRHARALCLAAIVEEINQQLGTHLRVSDSWYPSIEDANGMHIVVWRALEEGSGITLDLHNRGGIKAALIEGFKFGYLLAGLGVQVKELRQETDGTWFARLPLIWAPKRGFLQDWKNYTVNYHSSPQKTSILNGSNEVFQKFDQWVGLDRISNLMCFI